MLSNLKIALCLIISLTGLEAAQLPSDIYWLAASANDINGLQMINPQGLAVNPRLEEFIVADALNDRIIIFDTTGAVVFTFPTGENRHNPFGVAVKSSDEIIVSSMDSPELWIYDNAGQFINEVFMPEGTQPGRLDIDAQDNIFVVDRAHCAIIQLGSDGKVIETYKSNDEKCLASGVIISNMNTPALVSTEGNVFIMFDLAGNIVSVNGQHGRKPQEFSHPTSGTIDSHNRLWLVDSFKHEIKRFDQKFRLIDSFGIYGTATSEMFYPVDIKITPKGKMGILEKGANRLQIFRIENGK
jgi:streptogramin lyase